MKLDLLPLISNLLLMKKKCSQQFNQPNGLSSPLNHGKSSLVNLETIAVLPKESNPAALELTAPLDFEIQPCPLPFEVDEI